MKGIAADEAAIKAEGETIESLKNRVQNLGTNVSSSCRKRKGTMVSVTGSDQGCSDAELGAKPKKRTCVTTSTTEPAPVPANPRKPKKGMAATTKKIPSVAAWLKTLQAPPAPLTPPTRPPKTSTPAKELTFNSVSVCSTPGVFNSTEISESVPTPPACEISNVAEISFGSTRSSDNAHLNEALDRSEACHDFENPDLATKELLTAACEASKAEIENYCGQNRENLDILANTSMVYSGNERLSSGPLGMNMVLMLNSRVSLMRIWIRLLQIRPLTL